MNEARAQGNTVARRLHTTMSGAWADRARPPTIIGIGIALLVVALIPLSPHLAGTATARPISIATAIGIALIVWRRALAETPRPGWLAIAVSLTAAIPLQIWSDGATGAFPKLSPSVGVVLLGSGAALAYGIYQLARQLGLALGTWLDCTLGGAGLATLVTVVTQLQAHTANVNYSQVFQISDMTFESLLIGGTLAIAASLNWRPDPLWVAPALGLAGGLFCDALSAHAFNPDLPQHAAFTRLAALLPGIGFAVAATFATPAKPSSVDERRTALTGRAMPLMGLTSMSVALLVFLLNRTNTNVLIPTVVASLLATVRISLAIRSAQAFREISELATTDELTGLSNRRRLFDSIDSLLETHPGSSHALLLLDLNSFKEVNDSLGHPVGDALLVGIGSRLAECIPEKSILSRLGGDEFAILIPFASEAEPVRYAQLIRAALRPPFAIQGVRLQIGCAIGSARFPDDGIDAVTLLARADVAMYTAKRAGKIFQHYRPDLETDTLNRLQLMADMETALQEGQFEVRYQPMMEVASGRITGAEALVRWRHPRRGLLSPAVFLELVEQTGTLSALTKVVTADAVSTAALWRASGYEMLLAINIGSRELLDDLLVDNLFHELEKNGVEPTQVVVEVAEGAFVDTEVSERIVRRLRAAGVLVAIDDFGAGYSSLSRLRALDAIELKLDRSLTAAMAHDAGAAAVVDSSIQLAHALGMRLVAEGVEDTETFEKLTALGCDGVQGFYIAKPMTATELIHWLDQHSSVEVSSS